MKIIIITTTSIIVIIIIVIVIVIVLIIIVIVIIIIIVIVIIIIIIVIVIVISRQGNTKELPEKVNKPINDLDRLQESIRQGSTFVDAKVLKNDWCSSKHHDPTQ